MMFETTNSTAVWEIGQLVIIVLNLPTRWCSRREEQVGTRASGRINKLHSAIKNAVL